MNKKALHLLRCYSINLRQAVGAKAGCVWTRQTTRVSYNICKCGRTRLPAWLIKERAHVRPDALLVEDVRVLFMVLNLTRGQGGVCLERRTTETGGGGASLGEEREKDFGGGFRSNEHPLLAKETKVTWGTRLAGTSRKGQDLTEQAIVLDVGCGRATLSRGCRL